jgi:hypothetical protein
MPRSRSRRRRKARARIAAAVVAVVAIAVVLAVALGGSGSPRRGLLESMFQDDQYTLDQPNAAVVATTLDTLKSLGVDRVRVQVLWSAIAPDNLSPKRPRGFDATDPADYPASGWAPYDRLVRLAYARGLGVDFDITAPGPLWAMHQPAPYSPAALAYAPAVSAWSQFVTAVGRRYGGSYTPPGSAGPLPRVNYWSIWNEPNQPAWLSPQLRTVGGALVPDAPRLYREYADAAFSALQSTGHRTSTDTILIGETAPEGCTARGAGCQYPAAEQPLPPLPFVQSLYCVNAAYEPLRGSLAAALDCPVGGSPSAFVKANPGLFDATGYAHHPYSLLLAPNIPFRSDPGFVSLANLSTLEDGLDRIFSLYGVSRQLPIYLTEYGYETDPPKPVDSVSLREQAAYLDEAEYMAWSDPRVRTLSQFLLVDSAPDKAFRPGSSAYWSTFQTGLEYLGGAKKPSFDAYMLPVFVPDPSFSTGGSVLVWAMLRPARNGSSQRAVIEWRPRRGGYRTLATVTTDDPSNVLTAHVQPPGSGDIRIAWTSPTGQVLLSRTVAVAEG